MYINKFFENLVANKPTVKKKVAEALADQAKMAQIDLINKLKRGKNALKLKLNSLLPPSTTTSSLNVGSANFDPDAWVMEVHSTKISLVNKGMELKLAEATFQEWFSEGKSESENKGIKVYLAISSGAEPHVVDKVRDKLEAWDCSVFEFKYGSYDSSQVASADIVIIVPKCIHDEDPEVGQHEYTVVEDFASSNYDFESKAFRDGKAVYVVSALRFYSWTVAKVVQWRIDKRSKYGILYTESSDTDVETIIPKASAEAADPSENIKKL